MLVNIFALVFNMSITASLGAVFIICIRFVLNNRLPKIFSYASWSIVLVRLIIPVYFVTIFSVFNVLPNFQPAMEESRHPQNFGIIKYLPEETGTVHIPQISTVNETTANHFNKPVLSEGAKKPVSPAADGEKSVNLLSIIVFIASIVWAIGALSLFVFSVITYLRTVSRLKTAVLYKDNNIVYDISKKLGLRRKMQVFSSDRIETPVVCGIINPRIILPLSLIKDSDDTGLRHIVTHELIHIKRLDYIIKPLSVLVLCFHWFNPVIWLSFVLSQKDMEMSCDVC